MKAFEEFSTAQSGDMSCDHAGRDRLKYASEAVSSQRNTLEGES
ncbi:MAG TPA: hypothetical protein PLN19_02770 [Methanothrix sp.]|jgi:hypothetical protein|nr:hypothetical protein [Methanothrix sp.]